jgi:hypothetical protein
MEKKILKYIKKRKEIEKMKRITSFEKTEQGETKKVTRQISDEDCAKMLAKREKAKSDISAEAEKDLEQADTLFENSDWTAEELLDLKHISPEVFEQIIKNVSEETVERFKLLEEQQAELDGYVDVEDCISVEEFVKKDLVVYAICKKWFDETGRLIAGEKYSEPVESFRGDSEEEAENWLANAVSESEEKLEEFFKTY